MKRIPVWMAAAGLLCGAARADLGNDGTDGTPDDGRTPREKVVGRWQELYTGENGKLDKERFTAADRNGDGKLTWDEAVAAHLAGEETGGRERWNRAAGTDGALEMGEARDYLKWERAHRREIHERVKNHRAASGPAVTGGGAAAGLPLPPAAPPGDPDQDGSNRRDQAERKWRQGYVDPSDPSGYDQDRFERHAGDDGLLSKEEARDGATPLERRAGGEKRFDRADRDGDGSLTKKEAKRELDQERKAGKEKGSKEGKGRGDGKGKSRGGK